MCKYLQTIIRTPQRLWAWSQLYPYESIGYGCILLFLALAAKPLILIAASVAILGGIFKVFTS
jgi:hypothetical protein